MSQIISKWLQNRLGIIFNQHSWDEDHGGGIIAKLLQSYALLTEEQVNIIFAKAGAFYQPTLEVVRLAINRLGLHLSKAEFQDVVDAKDMAPTKLLYELYLVLHDKDASHFILSQQLHEHRKSSRFSVITDSIDSSLKFEFEKFNNPLAHPLNAKEEIVEFHINKYLNLLQKCKESRERYLNFVQENRQLVKSQNVRMQNTSPCLSEKDRFAIEQLPLDAKSLDQSTSELIKEGKEAAQMESIKPNKNVSNQIIKDIQAKAQKFRKLQGCRESFRKTVLKDLWAKVLAEQEHYYKHRFTERLQQQSIYEQQMASSLIAVRENQNQIAADKKHMMEMLREEQEQQFLTKLLNEDRMKEYERTAYYVEQERKKYLHQKLYERKIKRRQEKIKQNCRNALNDILDIAFHNIEYNETHNDELPRRKRDDLARLFIAKQPIFDLIEDVAKVIDVDPSIKSSNEEESKIETIKISELERQNALDDLTFEDYHNFKWPWDFSAWMPFDYYDDMVRGLSVLGHIVQRLLLAKYPRVHLTAEKPLPHTEVAACFTGLYDLSYLPALKQLLNARKIKVVELQECINYCITIFNDEVSEEYLETLFVQETDEALQSIDSNVKGLKNNSKALKKGSKKGSWNSGRMSAESISSKSLATSAVQEESDESKKSNQGVSVEEIDILEHVDKTNQTPKQFPCEELQLSSAGTVGKGLFEALHLGDTPNEHLNSGAIIEYLKSFDWVKLNGWVLVNYPQTLQQAIALEETLSCTRIPLQCVLPKDCLDDIIDIEERPDGNEDDLEAKRVSKLLECPIDSDTDRAEYETFLTAFIEMKTQSDVDPGEKYYECFKSPENAVALCRFYQDQGCKYTLLYNTIDFHTIKHLGKLILGDYSMPPKDSIALFTDTVRYVEANFNEIVKATSVAVKEEKEEVKDPDKKDKRKSNAKEKSGRKSIKTEGTDKTLKKPGTDKKRKSTKVEIPLEIEQVDEETQIPTPVTLSEEVIDINASPRGPAEYRWINYDLPIMPYYLLGLATLWENVEEVYINDMKQLFFRRRTILDSMIPYNTYVKTNLLEFIGRPDTKQKYLSEFQQVYNEFADDMREDEEVKAELHMRIEEFREKLWKICDERMMENENERIRVIQENWMTTLLIAMCNIYTSFLQLEVDRATDTCQLLVDYYAAMMTGAPCEQSPLEKIILEVIQLPKNVEDMDHIAPFVENAEETLKQVERKVDASSSVYVVKIKVSLDKCVAKINENDAICQKIKTQLQGIFDPTKSKKDPKKDFRKSLAILDPEEDVKLRANCLFHELEIALAGEYHRCHLRLKILEHVYVEEIQDVMEKCAGNFHGLNKDIVQRYRNEIRAVDEATNLLKRAVEEETRIQPEMLLEGDMFYVKLGSFMYETPLPDVDDVPFREPKDEDKFTISQLSRVTDILFRMAPKGTMAERAFAYLIQDLVVYKAEDDQEDFVPPLWKKLEPSQTNELMSRLFGISEYINWKDFIVYCMGIRFPEEYEILNTRKQFRELDPDMTEFIYEHQYPAMTFWFESEIEQPRLMEIRQLLYKLYSTNDRLNYPILLLDFCKDKNPAIGFAKALEVSLGKLVCHNEAQGAERYTNVLKRIMRQDIKRISNQMERQDTLKMSREMVEKLVEDTTNAATAILTDIDATEVPPICSYDIMQYWQEPLRMSESSDSTLNSSVGKSELGEYTTATRVTGYLASDGLVYQISFDVLLNIFSVTLPWVHKIRQFRDITFHELFAMIYNSLINEDVQVAYLYQILTNQDFLQMFERFYKFYERDPVLLLKEILMRDGNF